MKIDFLCGMRFFELTTEPLSLRMLEVLPDQAMCGAWVTFVGLVRDSAKGKRVVALEFEAYESMVQLELHKIADEVENRWPEVVDILLYHKLDRCEVGEIPVIAAIRSPHRKEAFEACAYMMDRLKATVPIWKKEICEDGETWVTPHP